MYILIGIHEEDGKANMLALAPRDTTLAPTCVQHVTHVTRWSHKAPGSHTLHLMSARRLMPARRSPGAYLAISYRIVAIG